MKASSGEGDVCAVRVASYRMIGSRECDAGGWRRLDGEKGVALVEGFWMNAGGRT